MTIEMRALQDPASNLQNTAEAYGMDSGMLCISRKVTRQDIEVVQNLIERCLQLYMNRNEVANTLLRQARVEPEFTILVWNKLEEDNADFFKAYYLRLLLRKQINTFNGFLRHQCDLMKYAAPSAVSSIPIQDGIQHMPVQHRGYTKLEQFSMPSKGHPQVDLMGNVSSHMVNGISAPGNMHSAQKHSGMGMDSSTADAISAPPFVKSEVDLSPTSGASNVHYPFTASEISDLSVDASAIGSTFTSHIASPERLHLGPGCGIVNSKESLQLEPLKFSFPDAAAGSMSLEDEGQLGNYSKTDVSVDSPEQNVEEFFADGIPNQPSQIEDESKAHIN
ncbi:hypothetical protein Tsubulata_021598 [Turnera subulata]|uniref:Angiotensin-converting enzyme 2 n=1 Tax=Turnera subulata TaxID=218843 RepID=A0A9Q0G4T9_9ROSI|nr:hypothetical protein Tsubulata_021598 [Turnera subulata]